MDHRALLKLTIMTFKILKGLRNRWARRAVSMTKNRPTDQCLKSINHKLQNIKDFNGKIFLFIYSRGFEAPVRGRSSLT